MYFAAIAGVAAENPPRVLILDSFGRDIAPFNTAVSALRTTLAQQLGEPVDIYEASLDAARFADPEKEVPFVEFLKSRFENRRLDLVVTVGAPAVKFMAKYRDTLFPHTAIIYMGVDPRLLPAGLLQTNATLVTQRVNLPGVMEDILQLKPDTTNAVIVFGNSPLEKFWVGECRREFQSFTNRVGFTWLNHLSLEQMLKQVSTLPPHSFIMFGMLVVDATGVPYDNDEAMKRIHAVAKAPIFAYFASQFGQGAVGGRLYQDSEVGIRTASAAVRILRGESPETIAPVILDSAAPVYDWRELQRWNLSGAALPEGSTVQFREPSFGEMYRGRILLVAAIFVLQIGWIIGLTVSRAKRIRAERVSRESEARFRTVANSAPVLIWMSGEDKLCIFFNKPWLDFTGRTLEQELGNGWMEGVHPEDRPRCKEAYQRAFEAREAFTLQYRLRRQGGDYRWISEHGVPRFDAEGVFAGYIGSCMDITENLRSEEKFRLAVEASPNAMMVVNQEGRITLLNAQVELVFGYGREELLGQPVEVLVPDRFHGGHLIHRGNYARRAEVRPMGLGRELFGRRKDGSEVPVEIGLNPITTSEGPAFLASIIDITKPKEMERQQREFKGLLINAHEEERARLARELHDDITQRLVRLAIDMGSTNPAGTGSKGSGSQLSVREELVRLTEDVHALSYQLHPSILDYLGLAEALRTEAERFSRREAIAVDLQLDEIPSTLPPETTLGLYRITQEALFNVAQHAQATRVQVMLKQSTDEIKLLVRDNGIGFDARRRPPQPSLGLAGMKERASLLGGNIEIESQPGSGTIITVTVPTITITG